MVARDRRDRCLVANAYRDAADPELESQVQLYRSYTSDLVRVDPNQLCLRKLKRISFGPHLLLGLVFLGKRR